MDMANYLSQIEIKMKVKISDDDFINHKLGVVNNMINYLSSKVGA